MNVELIGINHRTASLSLRERVILEIKKRIPFWDFPFIILQTCNRIEIYCCLTQGKREVENLFITEGLPSSTLYKYGGESALSHLIKVTSGLDSAIFGETEIQRQVKVSYDEACKQGRVTKELHFLFQKSLQVAKEIRTLAKPAPSLAKEIFVVCTKTFVSLKDKTFLLLGQSKTNLSIASFLLEKEVGKILFYSKFPRVFDERVERVYDLERWANVDVLISATENQGEGYLIKEQKITKPLLLFDLSVPRTIDPVFSHMQLVSFFDIEKINQFLLEREKETWQEKELLSLYADKRAKEIHMRRGQLVCMLESNIARVPWEGNYIADILHASYK